MRLPVPPSWLIAGTGIEPVSSAYEAGLVTRRVTRRLLRRDSNPRRARLTVECPARWATEHQNPRSDSNRLSPRSKRGVRPVAPRGHIPAAGVEPAFPGSEPGVLPNRRRWIAVGKAGLEPAAPASQMQCAANCATSRCAHHPPRGEWRAVSNQHPKQAGKDSNPALPVKSRLHHRQCFQPIDEPTRTRTSLCGLRDRCITINAFGPCTRRYSTNAPYQG